MNQKHLACLIVALAAVLFVQGAFQVRKRLVKLNADIGQAQVDASAAETRLKTERGLLAALEENSKPLIGFLDVWEPYLRAVRTPESGELEIAGRIKRSGIISLAQRFGTVALKDSPSIPRVVRANLTFEDDFANVLNWLGRTERDFPASRATNVRIVRGQSGNDIRMDLVLDIPLISQVEEEK